MMAAIIIFILIFPACFAADCRWSPCESKLVPKSRICRNHELGSFSGRIRYIGCNSTTERMECCKLSRNLGSIDGFQMIATTEDPDEECEWSSMCFVMGLQMSAGCNRNFGSDWRSNGHAKRDNCGLYRRRVQCCRK